MPIVQDLVVRMVLENAKRILNYARISIILFLDLLSNSEYKTKDNINNILIDNALIDKSKFDELQKLVEPIIEYIHL